MRIFTAVTAVLFSVTLAASAQEVITVGDEVFNITRSSTAPWALASTVDVAPGDPFDAAQSGARYLRVSGATDIGKLVVFFGNDQPHPRITVGQINPGATLSFWYRMANPDGGQAITLGIGLSSADWDPKPATGIFSGTGTYPQGNGVFMGGELANLHESAIDPNTGIGVWRQASITFTGFEQTLDPATELNRIFIQSAGWSVNPTFWMDFDNFVFTNGAGQQLHAGDANGDGKVTDADYTIWADNYLKNFGQVARVWADGDFNGDKEVTDADYTIWADNYGYGVGNAVPEPATMSLLGLGLFGLLRRRS